MKNIFKMGPLKACGVTNLTGLKIPGAINTLWVFNSIFHSTELSAGSNSLAARHRNTATHHTQTFSLNTFTHKVQVSASRTAIGAVLPIDVIVFRLFFSKFHIYISRYIHLLSVQGLAGTVLSPSSSFHSVRKTTLFFLPTLP